MPVDTKVSTGTETYRGFILDNVFHSDSYGDIHYNVYIPKKYNPNKKYALFISLPGYQGLYFQGVGENLKTEDFVFKARKRNKKMIIVAPQLNDWNELSGLETIELTEYFLNQYSIDKDKVFIEGYSAGGETLSWVLSNKPELYSRALVCSSQWDGQFQNVIQANTPIYFVVGENDEYYGSQPFKDAYATLLDLYKNKGLTHRQIDRLLVLDVKPTSYFENQNISNQHGLGGYLFCRDKKIMNWLLNGGK